jgi:hypothetical protein
MDTPRRSVGRPTTEAKAAEKTTLSLRVTPRLKQRLDDVGKEESRNLSQEAELRLERSFDNEDALDRAMTWAYGEDNAGLLHLVGHILRVVAPHGGEWLEDEAAAASVARGLVHMLRRLRAPDDGTMAERGIEKRVDDLLFDLAYVGSEHGSTGSPRDRRAAEQRRRFGSVIAANLIKRRRAVTEALEAMPTREWPQPDPSSVDSWEPIISRINERFEAEKVKRQVEGIRDHIARFESEDNSPAYRARQRQLIEFRIATLDDVDEAVRAELADLLAKAAAEGDGPAE